MCVCVVWYDVWLALCCIVSAVCVCVVWCVTNNNNTYIHAYIHSWYESIDICLLSKSEFTLMRYTYNIIRTEQIYCLWQLRCQLRGWTSEQMRSKGWLIRLISLAGSWKDDLGPLRQATAEWMRLKVIRTWWSIGCYCTVGRTSVRWDLQVSWMPQ